MANVFDVAKYILDSVGEISTMKLQKLCYYSLAWHMVWHEKKPLFTEKFLRSDNGPVCEDLFNIHRGLFNISADKIPSTRFSKSGMNDEEQQTIDQIIEDYGKYSGAQLSEMTRLEDPWKHTEKDSIINHEDIYSYYEKL